jgi:hypothetical protein
VEKVAVVIDQIITTVVDSIKQIDLTPDWVDDALAEINQNPLNKFQDQLNFFHNAVYILVSPLTARIIQYCFYKISKEITCSNTYI